MRLLPAVLLVGFVAMLCGCGVGSRQQQVATTEAEPPPPVVAFLTTSELVKRAKSGDKSLEGKWIMLVVTVREKYKTKKHPDIRGEPHDPLNEVFNGVGVHDDPGVGKEGRGSFTVDCLFDKNYDLSSVRVGETGCFIGEVNWEKTGGATLWKCQLPTDEEKAQAGKLRAEGKK
jgi:hypothetical protein